MAKPEKYKNLSNEDLEYLYNLGFQDGFAFKQAINTNRLDQLMAGTMAEVTEFVEKVGSQGMTAKFEDVCLAMELSRRLGISVNNNLKQ